MLEDKIKQERKERNKMHRRAQLAEAKYDKLCRLLEAEGAQLLNGPVVVKKNADAGRLLNLVSYESYLTGFTNGRKCSFTPPLLAIRRWFAGKIQKIAHRLCK